ncbi:cytochrome C oxidase subunit IV family protein [Schlesneria paludicola]|uniref:cytochrome C oxidase subunit IV family protein n=1 Tax=Schlesneria paludicola TaxID=360056 RepID=UPI00029AB7B3|nr:cytochrome C oxidase subunit IV family protein [Schlesneria paludicola]
MSHTPAATSPAAEHHHAEHHSHAMPLSILIPTFVALIVLTIVTVTASKLSLGAAEIWVAMGIATVKAALVALYFMHLRYDKPFNAMLILFSLVFAAVFVGLALVDSQAYQPEIGAYDLQNPPVDAAPAAAEQPAATTAPAADAAHK